MKKLFLLLLCPLLLLAACGVQNEEEEEPFSADFTIRPPESLTDVYYDIPMPSEADVSADEANPVVPDGATALRYDDLRALFADAMFGGEPEACAALWTQQVRYAPEGSWTQEDLDLLSDMAQDLTQIAPFPGMRQTDVRNANVIVHFADVPDAQFTYTLDADGAIVQGQITIPSKLPPGQRNALLAEKMFRLFGFFHTAETPLDSVLAEDPADYMTETDLILLEIAYGQTESGMKQAVCMEKFAEHFDKH